MIICMRSKSFAVSVGPSLALSLLGRIIHGRVNVCMCMCVYIYRRESVTCIRLVPKCRMRHDTVNLIESIWVNFKSSKQLV